MFYFAEKYDELVEHVLREPVDFAQHRRLRAKLPTDHAPRHAAAQRRNSWFLSTSNAQRLDVDRHHVKKLRTSKREIASVQNSTVFLPFSLVRQSFLLVDLSGALLFFHHGFATFHRRHSSFVELLDAIQVISEYFSAWISSQYVDIILYLIRKRFRPIMVVLYIIVENCTFYLDSAKALRRVRPRIKDLLLFTRVTRFVSAL